MQPITEHTPEDDVPDREPRRSPRTPAESSDFYPLTVFLWVLSVATVGTIVGLICTEFFTGYIARLADLMGN